MEVVEILAGIELLFTGVINGDWEESEIQPALIIGSLTSIFKRKHILDESPIGRLDLGFGGALGFVESRRVRIGSRLREA